MSELRPATTVLLLRDGPEGLEVFMVQRHRRSGFLPNAWVFPGGRVDPGDRLAGHPAVTGAQALAAALAVPLEEAVACAVAGVRETFEEAGVWLGTGALPAEERAGLQEGRVRLPDLLDAHRAGLDLQALRPWSWWVTPTAEPKRFDTRFLAARAPAGAFRHDERETVDSRWVSPRQALRADLAGFPLAPPTWWTLRELAAHPDAASALAAPRPARAPILPILHFAEQGLRLVLPGHPEHADPAVEGLADHITFEGGRWVAWRDGRSLD